MPTLPFILENLNKPILTRYAPLLGIDSSGRKPELVERLANALPQRLTRLVNACNDTERLLLAELAHNPPDGVYPVAFAAKHDTQFPVRGIYSWRGNGVDSILILVLEVDSQDGTVWLADNLHQPLQTLLPKPTPPEIQTVPEISEEYARSTPFSSGTRPIHVYEPAAHVFEECRRVLGLVQQGKIAISASSKRPTAAAVKRVAEVLLAPDFDLQYSDHPDMDDPGSVRAHAWPVLLQQCRWAKPAGTKLAITRRGQKVLADPAPDYWSESVQYLMSDTVFDELNRIPAIRGQSGRGKRTRTPPDSRREEVLAATASMPPGEWVAFDEFMRHLQGLGVEITPNNSPWNLYLSEQRYGYITNVEELSRQYVRAVLMETMATLGLVDIAYVAPHFLWPEFGYNWGAEDLSYCSRYDGLLYIRLNPLGQYSQNLIDEYTPPPMPTVQMRVLPTLEIVGVDQQQLPVHAQAVLEQFARKTSDAVWKLDETRIVAHLEQGGNVENVRDALVQHASDPLPETVTSFLDGIQKRANAVSGIEDALIIRFNDKTTAALIANDTAAAKLCMPAGNKAVAVPRNREQAFRTLMKKKGYPIPLT